MLHNLTSKLRVFGFGLGSKDPNPKTRPVLLCTVLLGFSQSKTDGLAALSCSIVQFTAFDLLFRWLCFVLLRPAALGSVRPLHAEIKSVFLHSRTLDAAFSVSV